MWGPSEPSNGPSNHFGGGGGGGNKNNDWSSGGNNSAGSWDRPRGNDPMMGGRNDSMAHGNRGDVGGWGPPPSQRQPSQWGGSGGMAGAPGSSRPGSTWDLESPNIPRRNNPDDGGTGHWGKPQQGGGNGGSSAAPGRPQSKLFDICKISPW